MVRWATFSQDLSMDFDDKPLTPTQMLGIKLMLFVAWGAVMLLIWGT